VIEEQLHGSEIAGAAINQGGFGPTPALWTASVEAHSE
jgi:hypothetical protein